MRAEGEPDTVDYRRLARLVGALTELLGARGSRTAGS